MGAGPPEAFTIRKIRNGNNGQRDRHTRGLPLRLVAAEVTVSQPARLSLRQVADAAMFKAIWKKLRRPLRALNFAGLYHATDPLDFIGFEWDIARSVDSLCEQIIDGSYQPSAPEIIRAAKSTGLTRPLAFLRPRDQLTYRVLTLRAENALLAASYSWTRFGRGDTDEAKSGSGPSGWFRAWLERQKQIWVITANHEYLVETDVANFFPSIDARAVARHVLANSTLGEDVVALLEEMLTRFAKTGAYRMPGAGGLPIEPFDGSRLLAHTYLRPVDAEFEAEGRKDQYSRWVDDIVIGAASREEALTQVQRAQLSLERLGLFPNSAKTRVIAAGDFTHDYMKATNDDLGEIDDENARGVKVSARFRVALAGHLHIPTPRPKAWERVLRRMYTLARTLDDDGLVPWWLRHLREYPGSADHVFEYMTTYRLTLARVIALRQTLKGLGGVYDDVELFARHYLAVAPNLDSAVLRDYIAEWALQTIDEELTRRPRLAAAGALLIGKHGSDVKLNDLRTLFQVRMDRDSPARQQTMVILAARGLIGPPDVRALLAKSKLESVQHIEFIAALLAGDADAAKRALATLQPSPRENPQRAMFRPRSLMLAPLLNTTAPTGWVNVRSRLLAQARSNPLRLRDLAAERLLQT